MCFRRKGNSWYIQTYSAIVRSVPKFSLCCLLGILHTLSDLLCKTCQQCPLYPLIPSFLIYETTNKEQASYKKVFLKTPAPTFNILNFDDSHPIPQPHPPQQSRPLIIFSMRLDTSPGSFLGTLGVGVFIIIAFAALVLVVVICVLISKLIDRCKRKRAETSKV